MTNGHKILRPKVVFGDRIVILRNENGKLIFYDVQRQKFVATLQISVYSYQVVGDDLIIQTV